MPAHSWKRVQRAHAGTQQAQGSRCVLQYTASTGGSSMCLPAHSTTCQQTACTVRMMVTCAKPPSRPPPTIQPIPRRKPYSRTQPPPLIPCSASPYHPHLHTNPPKARTCCSSVSPSRSALVLRLENLGASAGHSTAQHSAAWQGRGSVGKSAARG